VSACLRIVREREHRRARARERSPSSSASHCGRMALRIAATATVAGAGRRGFVDGQGQAAYLDGPQEMVQLLDGTVLVCDGRNNCLRVLDLRASSSSSSLTTLPTHAFLGPRSPVLIDGGAAVVLCDSGHNKLRMLQIARSPDGAETQVEDCTIAGTGRAGHHDGVADTATFCRPTGLCVLPDGSILVADAGNNAIRRVAGRPGRAGLFVTTVIGGFGAGFADGDVSGARLRAPSALAVDAHGTVLVIDSGNHAVRALHPPPDGDMGSPMWALTTLAGLGGLAGFVDGDAALAALLREPAGLACPAADAAAPEVESGVLVCDAGNNAVRRLGPGGSLGHRAGVYVLSSRGVIEPATAGSEVAADRAILLLRAGIPFGDAGSPQPPASDAGGFAPSSSSSSMTQRRVVVISPYLAAGAGAAGAGVGDSSASSAAFVPGATPLSPGRVLFKGQVGRPAAQDSGGAQRLFAALARLGVEEEAGGGAGAGASSSLPAANVLVYPDPLLIAAAHARYSLLTTVAGATPAVVDAVTAGANSARVRADIEARGLPTAPDAAAAVRAVLDRTASATGASAQVTALAALARYADGGPLESRFRKPGAALFLAGCAGTALLADTANNLVRALVSSAAVSSAKPPSPLLESILTPAVLFAGRNEVARAAAATSAAAAAAAAAASKVVKGAPPGAVSAKGGPAPAPRAPASAPAPAPAPVPIPQQAPAPLATASAAGAGPRRPSTSSAGGNGGGMREFVQNAASSSLAPRRDQSASTAAAKQLPAHPAHHFAAPTDSSLRQSRLPGEGSPERAVRELIHSAYQPNHRSQPPSLYASSFLHNPLEDSAGPLNATSLDPDDDGGASFGGPPPPSHSARTWVPQPQAIFAGAASAVKGAVSRYSGGIQPASSSSGGAGPRGAGAGAGAGAGRSLATSTDPLAAGLLAAAALAAPVAAADVERLASDPTALLNASAALLADTKGRGGKGRLSLSTGSAAPPLPPPSLRPRSGSRDAHAASRAAVALVSAAAPSQMPAGAAAPPSGSLTERPVGWRFEDEVAADRQRGLHFASDFSCSRDRVAEQESSAQGLLVRALLVGDTSAASGGGRGAGNTAATTTATPALLNARYTRHTLASAQHLSASGRPVVRTAPAFVNVSRVIERRVAALKARAAAGSGIPILAPTAAAVAGRPTRKPAPAAAAAAVVAAARPSSSFEIVAPPPVPAPQLQQSMPPSLAGESMVVGGIRPREAGALIAAALSPPRASSGSAAVTAGGSEPAVGFAPSSAPEVLVYEGLSLPPEHSRARGLDTSALMTAAAFREAGSRRSSLTGGVAGASQVRKNRRDSAASSKVGGGASGLASGLRAAAMARGEVVLLLDPVGLAGGSSASGPATPTVNPTAAVAAAQAVDSSFGLVRKTHPTFR
jgi:hypothetical protein